MYVIISMAPCLQCFDTVGRAAGRASGLYKTEWWGAGMVICLEQGADLHMAQLMPLPLTVSCFSKIQIGFTFLVPAHPGSLGQRAVKWVLVLLLSFLWHIRKLTHQGAAPNDCVVADLGMDEGEDEPVPLPNVNAAILKKVIQWCTYHKDDPPTAEDDENKEKRTDDICTWDVEFLKVDQGTLFELILVSAFTFLLFNLFVISRVLCPVWAQGRNATLI